MGLLFKPAIDQKFFHAEFISIKCNLESSKKVDVSRNQELETKENSYSGKTLPLYEKEINPIKLAL